MVNQTESAPYDNDGSMAAKGTTGNQSSEPLKRYSSSGVLRDGRPMLNSPAASNQSTFSLPGQKKVPSLPSSGSSTPVTSKKSGLSSASFTPEVPQVQRMNSFSAGIPVDGNANMSHLPRTPQGNEFSHWPPFDHNARDGGPDRMPSMQMPEHVRPGEADAKSQFAPDPEFMHNFFARGGTGQPGGMNGWSLPDTFPSTAERLTAFCQFDESDDSDAQLLRRLLSHHNLEELYARYLDYHVHWPFMNVASLNVAESYDGLLLAMICVGAVYSDRATIHEVRSCLKHTKKVLKRSEAFRLSERFSIDASEVQGREFGIIQQLKALLLIDGVAAWHGDGELRGDVMQCNAGYIRLVRSLGLLASAPPSSPAYSVLHQPGPVNATNLGNWDSAAWLLQESRIRVVIHLFLLNAALVMYFNFPTYLEPTEINLPLPADDAAFDASTARDCARALGLHGDAAAEEANPSGTRSPKQPELHALLARLQKPGAGPLAPRSTNAFSKFILVHALIVQIHFIRRRIFLKHGTQGAQSAPNAQSPGQLTLHSSLSIPQFLRNIVGALNRWMVAWRHDLPLQFADAAPRRAGFCRDAEPFYFIAKLMLQSAHKDLVDIPADARCQQVMRVLKLVKARLAADERSKSGGGGGGDAEAAGAADEDFAMDDLSWDMKLLFAPLASPGSIGKFDGILGQGGWPGEI